MSPDRDPRAAEAWLRRARSNLARARALASLPDVLYEDLCIDAQQATEKSLKAILVHAGVAFPRTHSIAELLTLVGGAGIDLSAGIESLAALTPYAVETRYPGFWEDVTAEDHAQAVEAAERALAWAERVVAPNPPDPEEEPEKPPPGLE